MEPELKKILIIGPIGDFGGREVEVNIMARAFLEHYSVRIFSTGYFTARSFALKGLSGISWDTLDNKIYEKSIVVRFLAWISFISNDKKKEIYRYVGNKWVKKIIDLNALKIRNIDDEVKNADLVIMPMQLTSNYLNEIVLLCERYIKPCFVRTTGNIIQVPNPEVLKKVTCFIHHSKANAKNLNRKLYFPYVIIDQCSLNEDQLLELSIKKKSTPLCFGYLGRLSEEKGILPLVNFFSETKFPFIVAGDGEQKLQLLDVIREKTNCKYLGLVPNDKLISFFEIIDVLIISSYEEAGPLVGLEAMSAGKVIISTKVGAMPERLMNSKNQFWFKNNFTCFDKAINKVGLLDSEEFYNISKENRERYLERYSREVISEQYLQLVKNHL
ncbi:MAG: glycosyltransferase family 4 protein [Flavobacterium sp.]